MNKKDALASLGGLVYAGLGAVILATVSGLLDKASVYGFIVPATLLVSGLLLLINPQPRTIKIISSGMVGIGAIALLVRYTPLNRTLVNTIVGIVLVTVGVSLLSRVYHGRKQASTPPANQ